MTLQGQTPPWPPRQPRGALACRRASPLTAEVRAQLSHGLGVHGPGRPALHTRCFESSRGLWVINSFADQSPSV